MCSSSEAADRATCLSLADGLAWRRYGDEVIAADVHARVSHVLRGRAARVFLDIAAGTHLEDGSVESVELARRLLERRILASAASRLHGPGRPIAVDAPDSTEAVLFAWAARNRVPLSGSLEVTAACNLSCRHCYCPPAAVHALPTEELLGVIDDVADAGALFLTVTGGEVFLRPDWVEVLRHLETRRFCYRINTNGVLLDDAAVAVLTTLDRLRELHVSIYSAEPQVHDHITGVPGSHARSLRAVEMLLGADIPVTINCSVMRSNIDTFESVQREIGDRLGVVVRYDPRIVSRHDGVRDNLRERLSTVELRRFYERRLGSGLGEAEFLNPKRRSPDHGSPCSAGTSYFAVGADATLYPCFQLRLPLGSLLEHRFADLWRTSAALGDVRAMGLRDLPVCVRCVRLPFCNLCVGMGQSESGDWRAPAEENCRDASVRLALARERGIVDEEGPRQGG